MAGIVKTSRASLATWGCATALAAAIHASVLLAFVRAPDEPDGSEDGARAVEIGLELTSGGDLSDLPPGPESEASTASAASAERPPVEELKPDVPVEPPTQADEADHVVAPEPPRKEKPVVEEKPAEQPAQASADSVASEATAAPATEARKEAETSRAPTVGLGEDARRVVATWQRQLVAHLDRNKRFPRSARRTAEITVSFTLDRTGRVVSVAVVKGSGDPAFDEAALAMVRRSDPVPAPPPLVADEGLTFTLPVIFGGRRG
jgi:TonB family protein